MIGIKTSKNMKDIDKRIAKLPQYSEDMMFYFTKKDAVDFIKAFQRNIKNDRLNTMPLVQPTIDNKVSKGYGQPETPLYGAGKDEKNSYYNLFMLRKMKKGWKVIPKNAKHHESSLTLKQLFYIQEHGATIQVTDKMRNFLHYIGIHLRPDTTIIRIPPRPVAFLTFEELMNKKKKDESSQKMKRAINQYINTGKDALIEKILEQEQLLDKEIE